MGGARLAESILDVNFPQNESRSSTLPLKVIIDTLESLAAENNLHSSVTWVGILYVVGSFFSNSAFHSKISPVQKTNFFKWFSWNKK